VAKNLYEVNGAVKLPSTRIEAQHICKKRETYRAYSVGSDNNMNKYSRSVPL